MHVQSTRQRSIQKKPSTRCAIPIIQLATNLFEALLGYLLLLGWGFAMIWVGIWVGSAMRSVRAVEVVRWDYHWRWGPLVRLDLLSCKFEPSATILPRFNR